MKVVLMKMCPPDNLDGGSGIHKTKNVSRGKGIGVCVCVSSISPLMTLLHDRVLVIVFALTG